MPAIEVPIDPAGAFADACAVADAPADAIAIA
jgi:hypothetical protein